MSNVATMSKYPTTAETHLIAVPARCAHQMSLLLSDAQIPFRAWRFNTLRRMENPPMSCQEAMDALSYSDKVGVYDLCPIVYETYLDQQTAAFLTRDIRASDAWLDEQTAGIEDPQKRQRVREDLRLMDNPERGELVQDLRREVLAGTLLTCLQ